MIQPDATPIRESRRPADAKALRERVSAAILDAAAHVFALHGSQASMTDVATGAGVARATVYRYFPSRQALLDALAEVSVADAGARLASARIDEVPAEEAVRRATRALVEVGDYFLVVARERVRPDPDEFERRLAAPIRQLFERGRTTGEIRDDVPASWLAESFVALVVSIVAATPVLGREDTIAAIASMFLEGAGARPASLP